jgi:hypothetical protein
MMGRVGAKQPLEQGRSDWEELAGVVVGTKQVERISTQLGVQVEAFCRRERQAILTGKVAPWLPAVPILYIAIDATGVPVIPRETEGRRGKRRQRQGQNPRSQDWLRVHPGQARRARIIPFETMNPRPMWAPSKRLRLLVPVSMRKPCAAVYGRPIR